MLATSQVPNSHGSSWLLYFMVQIQNISSPWSVQKQHSRTFPRPLFVFLWHEHFKIIQAPLFAFSFIGVQLAKNKWHTFKMNKSMSFNIYMLPLNHHHNQDNELRHYSWKFPRAPFSVILPYSFWPQVIITLLSVKIITLCFLILLK